MNISKDTSKICEESEMFEQILSLNNKTILELGCGKADKTRQIASAGHNRTIIATEVDQKQHSINLQIDDLTNVSFILGGSEAIPLEDDSVDVAFMFKSLHHVPANLMNKAIEETRRVLKPGGFAYISEPVFEGEFNEVLRLFHDEEIVRKTAFQAIFDSVEKGDFLLAEQLFFKTPVSFASFEVFEQRIINVTHTDHALSAEHRQQVKKQFDLHMQQDGANFLTPIRVDLLQKPS